MSLFELLEEVPHPLAIVTAGKHDEPGRRGGMTAAWLSRVSYEPPLLAVSVAPTRHTYALVREFGAFAVNIVSRSLVEAAMGVFGSVSGWHVDKFVRSRIVPVSARRVVAPVIPNAALVAECRYVTEFRVGDHVLIVGEVVEAYRGTNELPVVYFRGSPAELAGG